LIGKAYGTGNTAVDNKKLISVNDSIRKHPVEKVGAELRKAMSAMKNLEEL